MKLLLKNVRKAQEKEKILLKKEEVQIKNKEEKLLGIIHLKDHVNKGKIIRIDKELEKNCQGRDLIVKLKKKGFVEYQKNEHFNSKNNFLILDIFDKNLV